jgi:hypothetical protein
MMFLTAQDRDWPMHRLTLSTLALLTLMGCTDTADTFPMNQAAKDLGPVKVSFVRTGVGRGPVTITLSDGEVLTGEYRVAFSTEQGFGFTNVSGSGYSHAGNFFGFSGSATTSALLIGDGPVQFVASGPRTQILCRGTSSTMGHGNGQCQTFEGALWTVSW